MFKNTEHPEYILKNHLKEIRILRNLSQEELAQKAGTTAKTISSIERKNTNPTLKLAYMLAFILDVPVTELFYLDSPESLKNDNLDHKIQRVSKYRHQTEFETMEIFSVEEIRNFENKDDYDNQLRQYCNKHNYNLEDKKAHELAEEMWANIIREQITKRFDVTDVSMNTICTDQTNKNKKFKIVWFDTKIIDYSFIFIIYHPQTTLTDDYQQEIFDFCKDFFESTNITKVQEENIQYDNTLEMIMDLGLF